MHDNTITGGDTNRKTRRHTKQTQRAYAGIPEAAAYLGIGTQAVRKLIADGKLPAYRIGTKTIRIRIEDLDNVLIPVPAGGAL